MVFRARIALAPWVRIMGTVPWQIQDKRVDPRADHSSDAPVVKIVSTHGRLHCLRRSFANPGPNRCHQLRPGKEGIRKGARTDSAGSKGIAWQCPVVGNTGSGL
jgi:hypothetical protein